MINDEWLVMVTPDRQALEALKSAGADLNFARADGATALDLALDQEHSETVLWRK